MKIDIDYQRILIGSLLLIGLGWVYYQCNQEATSGNLSELLSDRLKKDKPMLLIVASLVTIFVVVLMFPKSQKENYNPTQTPVTNDVEIEEVLDEVASCDSCSNHSSNQEAFANENAEEPKEEPLCTTKMTTPNNDIGSVTLYFATWCGYSRQILAKDWPEVFSQGRDNPKYSKIKFEQICCEGGNQQQCQIVRGYPTILFTRFTDNEEVIMEEYQGNRSSTDILQKIDAFFGL